MMNPFDPDPYTPCSGGMILYVLCAIATIAFIIKSAL